MEARVTSRRTSRRMKSRPLMHDVLDYACTEYSSGGSFASIEDVLKVLHNISLISK